MADLRGALGGCEQYAHQAVEIIRGLIHTIMLTPAEEESDKTLSTTLEGQIASILAMAAEAKASLDESNASLRVTKLIAGTGSGLCNMFRVEGMESNLFL